MLLPVSGKSKNPDCFVHEVSGMMLLREAQLRRISTAYYKETDLKASYNSLVKYGLFAFLV